MRSYQDQIEVRLAVPDEGEPGTEQTPTMFVWRGRLYVVRAVLSRWRARSDWWRTALQTEGSAALAAVVAPEQTVWRVEASPGRQLGVGTYDLACAPETGGTVRWTLLRVAD